MGRKYLVYLEGTFPVLGRYLVWRAQFRLVKTNRKPVRFLEWVPNSELEFYLIKKKKPEPVDPKPGFSDPHVCNGN
jgi:hypothetical protein